MTVLVNKRLTKQPQTTPVLDRSNSLTAGLFTAYTNGFDAASGKTIPASDGAALVPTINGMCMPMSGSNYVDFGTGIGATGSLSYLTLVYYSGDNGGGYADVFSLGDRATLRLSSGNNGEADFYTFDGSSWQDTQGQLPLIPVSTGQWVLAAAVHDIVAGTNTLYVQLGHNTTVVSVGATPRNTGTHSLRLGLDDETGRSFTGQIAMAAVWNRALKLAEVQSLTANPWQLFKAPSSRFFTPSSVTGVTGTFASTQGGNTDALTGTVAITGTAALVQAKNTDALAGTVLSSVTGTLASTQQPNTDALVGTVAITGAEAATQQKNTDALTGTVAVSGTLASTQQPNTDALSGTVISGVTGTIASTQGANIDALAGTVSISGTSATAQAKNIGTLSGTVAVFGTEASTQGLNTFAAAGSVITGVTGTIVVTETNDAASFTGAVAVSGTSGLSQQKNTDALTGTVAVTGTEAATQGLNTFVASGVVGTNATGTIATTETNDTTVISGTVAVSGTAATVQRPNTDALAGTVAIAGTEASTQGLNTLAAIGSVLTGPVTGTLATTQGLNTFSAGNVLHAVANQTLLPPTPLAAATVLDTATSSTTFLITQFALVGKMSLSQNVVMDPITQYARVVDGGVGHFIATFQTVDVFTQTATATTIRTVSVAGAFGAFAQTATVSHAGVNATAVSTLPAFGQTATAAALLRLTAGQIILPFGNVAAATSTRKLTGAQTLPPFIQLAVIPGYAAFVPNKRTYVLNAEQRGYVPLPEIRTNTITPEVRSVSVNV